MTYANISSYDLLHVGANLVISISFLIIPVVIYRYMKILRIKKFATVYVFIVSIIVFCGIQNLLRIFIDPIHMLKLTLPVKMIIGLFLCGTFYYLYKFVPNPNLTPRHILEEEIILRKQAEIELRDAQIKIIEKAEELEIKNAELEKFAYVASHDLSEPLRKIATFSELLTKEVTRGDTENSILYLEKINSATKRMSSLMSSILTFSRLNHSMEEKVVPVDLNNTLREAILDMELLIFECKTEIILENPFPIVEGISFQFYQIFQNIISNSIKFCKKGVSPIIKISSFVSSGNSLEEKYISSLQLTDKDLVDNDYMVATFKDNGIGFGNEHKERIFEIFQRLHGVKSYSGTGIGLAIVRKSAELHKGLIVAESEEGEGSIFTLILPLIQRKSKIGY